MLISLFLDNKGLGYSFVPTIYSFFGCCIFRIFWNYVVYSPVEGMWNHSLAILYICYPISWILVFGAESITYFALKKKIKAKCDKNLHEYELKHNKLDEVVA